jgi:hypothetical protein
MKDDILIEPKFKMSFVNNYPNLGVYIIFDDNRELEIHTDVFHNKTKSTLERKPTHIDYRIYYYVYNSKGAIEKYFIGETIISSKVDDYESIFLRRCFDILNDIIFKK